MFKYVLKRLFLGFLTLVIILSLTFIVIQLLPFTKPGGISTDEMFSYYVNQVNEGFVKSFSYRNDSYGELLWSYTDSVGKDYYFYEVPLIQQYFSWIKNIVFHWDWGVSSVIKPNITASTIIKEKIGVTMLINIISLIITVPLGIALGVYLGIKKDKYSDKLISTIMMIFISLPSFVVITTTMFILAYVLKILPSQWPSTTAPLNIRLLGFVIPILSMSIGSIASYSRYLKAELKETFSEEYVEFARAKGLTNKDVIKRHCLKNAMVPILPMIIHQFTFILNGSLILENLYGIPGIGSLFIDALSKKDYNVLFVNMAIYTSIGLLADILVDLSYNFLDPRIRMGER